MIGSQKLARPFSSGADGFAKFATHLMRCNQKCFERVADDLEARNLREGSRILDLGASAGEPSLTIAARTSGFYVVSTDYAPPNKSLGVARAAAGGGVSRPRDGRAGRSAAECRARRAAGQRCLWHDRHDPTAARAWPLEAVDQQRRWHSGVCRRPGRDRQLDLARAYPGMRGMGLFNQADSGDLPALAARMQAEYGSEVEIHPPVDRGTHYVITRIEPLAANYAALGLDLAFEEGRREAIRLSLSRSEAVLTRPIVLVQDARQGAENSEAAAGHGNEVRGARLAPHHAKVTVCI